MDKPLISCLCVTKNRPKYLKKSIEMFLAQTYSNLELVIVCDDNDSVSAKIVEEFDIPNLLLITKRADLTLGELRNIAVNECNGELFCQWDDDDWYHKDRIKLQYDLMSKNRQDCSVLTNWIIYDERSCESYFSEFRLWEGSILCRKEVVQKYNVFYPSIPRGEDTIFLNNLAKVIGVYPAVLPGMYIYRIHKNNTWSAPGHFDFMIKKSSKIEGGLQRLIKKIMAGYCCPVEASKHINESDLLRQCHYFFHNALNCSNDEVVRYMENISNIRSRDLDAIIEC